MAGPARKSDKIRVIFRELRKAAGPDVPASDLIKLAHVIFRAYNQEPEERDGRFGTPRFRATIENMPVDTAMKDGGWAILYFEKEQRDAFATETMEKRINIQRAVQKYLGEQWPHQLARD
jgi:hypothetical protein